MVKTTTLQQEMASQSKPHMEMVEQFLLLQVKGNDVLKLNRIKAK